MDEQRLRGLPIRAAWRTQNVARKSHRGILKLLATLNIGLVYVIAEDGYAIADGQPWRAATNVKMEIALEVAKRRANVGRVLHKEPDQPEMRQASC